MLMGNKILFAMFVSWLRFMTLVSHYKICFRNLTSNSFRKNKKNICKLH